MSALSEFSLRRTMAIAYKELIKIKLDPNILAIMLAVPITQIALFGYAIEFFPKHLPAAIVNYDNSPITRHLIQALQSTEYFDFRAEKTDQNTAEQLLKQGYINFIFTIPPQFTRDLIRENNPKFLMEVDASIANIMGGSIQAVQNLQNIVFNSEFKGPLYYLTPTSPFNVQIQTKYNPSLQTTHSIIPGLIGVIIMIATGVLTSMTIVEEKVNGHMETLLNSYYKPIEIMVGKFLCYFIIGYIQLLVVLYLSTSLLFDVPIYGSLITFLLVSIPYIIANLFLGLLASVVSNSQLEAIQFVNFFFLPSLLLSGFTFPFYGMPTWARWIGEMLPITHYMRITSGIMLKGYGWQDVLIDLWPIILFILVFGVLAVFSFKRTLD